MPTRLKISGVYIAGVQTHGVQGFLHGLAPRLLRRALMAALSWTVYEQVSFQPGTNLNCGYRELAEDMTLFLRKGRGMEGREVKAQKGLQHQA